MCKFLGSPRYVVAILRFISRNQIMGEYKWISALSVPGSTFAYGYNENMIAVNNCFVIELSSNILFYVLQVSL